MPVVRVSWCGLAVGWMFYAWGEHSTGGGGEQGEMASRERRGEEEMGRQDTGGGRAAGAGERAGQRGQAGTEGERHGDRKGSLYPKRSIVAAEPKVATMKSALDPVRRRDCHFTDTPCLSRLKDLLKVQGGAIK